MQLAPTVVASNNSNRVKAGFEFAILAPAFDGLFETSFESINWNERFEKCE